MNRIAIVHFTVNGEPRRRLVPLAEPPIRRRGLVLACRRSMRGAIVKAPEPEGYCEFCPAAPGARCCVCGTQH